MTNVLRNGFACAVAMICSASAMCSVTAWSAEPSTKLPADMRIFNGEPRLLLINGYSTSFQWWAFLQRKIDRHLEYDGGPNGRTVEVQSVTKGGTPIASWMNPNSGERSPAWKQMLTPTIQKEKGKRLVFILAQQSLQGAYPGGRAIGIRNAEDSKRIEHGADVVGRYANNLLEDGAAAVIVGMHIYKRSMEPAIGHERLALTKLIERNPDRVFAGPDVWEPTRQQFPLAFDTDRAHPNFIGAEIMAHFWFSALLEREGLDIPEWSRREMETAIRDKPLGVTRDNQLFAEKLKEWKIENRRPSVPQRTEQSSSPTGRPGIGSRILERYDKDGDGTLNEEEQATFRQARQQRNRSGAEQQDPAPLR